MYFSFNLSEKLLRADLYCNLHEITGFLINAIVHIWKRTKQESGKMHVKVITSAQSVWNAVNHVGNTATEQCAHSHEWNVPQQTRETKRVLEASRRQLPWGINRAPRWASRHSKKDSVQVKFNGENGKTKRRIQKAKEKKLKLLIHK